MGYRRILPAIMILLPAFFLFGGCSGSKSREGNIYYVEMLGFKNDSLRDRIAEGIMGKVSYYKNNKLEILSENYITPDFPELHYFRNAESLENEIDPGTKKIRVQFMGEYSNDSISYSLQKHVYRDDKWVKTSDMGVIKATTTSTRTRRFAIYHYSNEIINNIVTYTYN